MASSFSASSFQHTDTQSVGGESLSSEYGVDQALYGIRMAMKKLDEQSTGSAER